MALVELYDSRPQANEPLRRSFERRWECNKADISEAAGGWTVSGLPVEGDAYPYGTWSGKITPTLQRLRLIPRARTGKALIIGIYEGNKEWVD